MADRRRAALPLGVVAYGDRDPTLLAGAAEYAVRRHLRVAIAAALRLAAADALLEHAFAEHRDAGLLLRQIDVLSFAGGAAMQQGGQHRHRAVQPAGGIAVRDPDVHWRPAGVAGQRGHAGQRYL